MYTNIQRTVQLRYNGFFVTIFTWILLLDSIVVFIEIDLKTVQQM